VASFKSVTVGIPVPDLHQAVEWYRRLLGDVTEINPAPGVWEFQVTRSGWLQLLEGWSGPPGGAVVRFETDDIEASRARVEGLGVEVGKTHTVPGAVRYFEFSDPFGNRLSFYEMRS